MNQENEGAVVDGAAKEEESFDTISQEAWADYNNPLTLGGIRPRGLLPLTLAFDVANAIGRSLTQADLQFLVQKDGERVVCAGCGKEFQPVKWVAVTDRLISALKMGIEFGQLNGEVRWAGSRIVKVDEKGVPHVLSFCGSFFFYDPRRRDETTGAEYFSVNRQSCLGQAYHHDENRDEKGKSRPIRSIDSALESVLMMERKHEARREEIRRGIEEKRSAVTRGVGDAFKKLEAQRRR